MGFPVIETVTTYGTLFIRSQTQNLILCVFFILCVTSIVVTIKVLLASVSDALRSREVEFMANVLLEYQVPICGGKRGITREDSDNSYIEA